MADSKIIRRDLGRFPDLCALGPRLLTVVGLFRVWMIDVFSDPENMSDPGLKHLRWDEDPKRTGITIEASTVWEPRTTGYRPAVIIRRHAWKRVRLGINDNLSYGFAMADGVVERANWWTGACTLFCLGGTGGEADKIANTVYEDVNRYSKAVVRKFGGVLKHLEVVEVGEAGILEEAGDETFVVPVTVAHVFEETWRNVDPKDRLTKIDMALVFDNR